MNGLLYAGRGQKVNAAASFSAMAPIVGTGLKLGMKGIAKAGTPVINVVNTGKRTGSAAYKSLDVGDAQHFFSDIIDNYVS